MMKQDRCYSNLIQYFSLSCSIERYVRRVKWLYEYTYCGPFVCPTIPNIKSNVGRNGNHHITATLQFSLAPVVSLYFGSHFRKVVFLCRKRFPDNMFYVAAVAKAAPTSKFDLSCRTLSGQRAHVWYTANTCDARTNLTSMFVWSSVRGVRSIFDDYRYIITGTTFISYAINMCSMIPGTKGQSTCHRIRYTYVRDTCMDVINTSHTWCPALDSSIHALHVVKIFCRTAR